MWSQSRGFLIMTWAAILALGCQPDANEPPIYRNGDDYQEALSKVRELTKEPFEALHEGFPISEREKKNLLEADRLIDGMIAYKSDIYAPYVLKGLTKRALGDFERAKKAFEQAMLLAPKDPKGDNRGTVGRVYDEMSTLFFEQNDFSGAEGYSETAVSLVPDDPSILTNAASIKVQLNKPEEALSLLERALKRDPNYARALDLKKLVLMSRKK